MASFNPTSDIRILREPTVYLVGRQTVGDAELDRFLADHGVTWQTDTEVAGEYLMEVAGRLCYMSFAKPRPGGNKAYTDHILEVGHGSVLEHSVWNFIFVGISRTLTHELIRHRAGFGYSQLSQRYVDESVAEYVEPDCIADNPELHQIWLDSVSQSHQAYMKLTEKLLDTFKTSRTAPCGANWLARPPAACCPTRPRPDFCHRQRPVAAAFHRAAGQPARRGGDSQAGDPGSPYNEKGSAPPLQRLSARPLARRHV